MVPLFRLNLALLIVPGARFAPLVFIASFLSELLIADPPIPADHLVLPNLVIALANAAAATWLRRTFEPDVPFGLGTVARFIPVAFGLPVVISLFAVGAYVLTGMPGYSTSTVWNAVSSWWIADTVGILTITPLCLLGVRTFAQENTLGEATQAELSFHLTSLRGVVTVLVDLGGIAPRGGYTNLTAYPAGEFVEVAVTDTGVGISPEQLGSLFTIEQRTSTAGTEGKNGTGLGLHICRELVEAEGGTIWVDSTQGAGTTFYVTLPAPPARSPSRKTPDLSTHPHENVVSSPGASQE